MKIMYRRCAGLDIHQKSIAVCIRIARSKGDLELHTATFGTFTEDLERLRDWRRLCQIPGIRLLTAWAVVAEIGTDMTRFEDAAHLASWAGLCPGNSESAGKRHSGRTRKGNSYLRRALCQSAWAAARTNDSFLSAVFFRIVCRSGLKKAAIAIAHRLLVILYTMLRDGTEYRELGGDYFDHLQPERTAQRLIQRLDRLGFDILIKPKPAT